MTSVATGAKSEKIISTPIATAMTVMTTELIDRPLFELFQYIKPF